MIEIEKDMARQRLRIEDRATQEQILAELKKMNHLLLVIASQVQPAGASGIKYYLPLDTISRTTASGAKSP